VSNRVGWQRVRKGKPCPICDKPDWCLIAADGSAAICARAESAKRCGGAGWLHRLRDDLDQPRRATRYIPLTPGGCSPNLAGLATNFQQAIDAGRLYQLAACLGLSVESLTALGIGWSRDFRSWSFPMRDAKGAVVGIRLRRLDGSKFAVKGGKEGLFLPATDSTDSRLLVCEGPTDMAALLDLGFGAVVGRPSCSGGIRLLVELVQRQRTADVVIVADGDEPGRRGASNLASVLVAYVPTVKVIAPPAGIKDVRDWLRSGGTKAAVEQAVAAAQARRLTVRAVAKKG
jgi:hypothetical protein